MEGEEDDEVGGGGGGGVGALAYLLYIYGKIHLFCQKELVIERRPGLLSLLHLFIFGTGIWLPHTRTPPREKTNKPKCVHWYHC